MNNECTVVFWDVQHGHAAYIKTPNGRHIVVDLGTGKYSGNNAEFSPLLHLKNNYGVDRLDQRPGQINPPGITAAIISG